MRQRRDAFTEINITPLTDIFLVLLIIMMVIAPLLDSQGLKMATPSVTASQDVTEDPTVIRLYIDSQGQYRINDQPVSADQIQSQLFQMKKDFPDGLIIESEPDALHGHIVQAMDAARGAGIEKLAVSRAAMAEPEPSEG
jgi:Biopolymer transport protein